MPPSGLLRSSPPPSSSLAGRSGWCLPTSAPVVALGRLGPPLHSGRPLAGFRLSRETVPVDLPCHWPWSPSLPAGSPRLGPPFGGLPGRCDHPTPLVSSSPRPFVLGDFRPWAGAERSLQVRTQSFVPTPSPIRPARADGFGLAAGG